MIFDCHTHINSPLSEIETAEHLEACEKVDVSIVLTTTGQQRQQANKDVGKYVKNHQKMVGFAAVNPVEDGVSAKNLKACIRETGLSGLVLSCAEDKFHPAHSRAMRLYEAAQKLAVPVFFHNCPPFSPEAVLEYAQPFLLDEVARSFPSLKMIIGGMGMPFVRQTLCILAKHENVYADLTICPEKVWDVYNIVLNAHEADVMNKLLFGSGYPLAQPGHCIETLLGFNKLLADTNLPNVPREKIRGIIERDGLGLLGISRD